MNKNKILTLVLAHVISLTGCSVMNQEYDCPLQKTASCISLAEMDDKITYDMLGEQKQANNNPDTVQGVFFSKESLEQTRKDESPLKIWVAPYIDQNGNFHDANYVYVASKDAAWTSSQTLISLGD